MADHGLKMVSSLAATNSLAADYLAGKAALRPFFGGHYTDRGRLRELAGKIGRDFDRARAARLLRAQETFPAVRQAGQRLERFVAENGFIVATGQQPVLFGGPLYVLYKALTLIKIARYAEKILEVPVLPVFWNASEDHDLAEVSSIELPNLQGCLETITLPVASESDRPACLVELGDEAGDLLGTLRRLLPDTEFRGWLLALLAAGYTRGSSLGRAFSHYLAGLLEDYGIFVVDACHPALREQCRDLFEAEIFDAASSHRVLKDTGDRLAAAGYRLQVTPLASDTSLFMILDGVREKLQPAEKGEGFRLKRSGREVSAGRIRELLESRPGSFSPGVLMRPLVEASLLGTLCYVAGPGEIAYYAQMGDLYRLRNLEMPVIYPRLGGIVLEKKTARVLEKHGLEPQELRDGAEAVAGRLVAGHGPQALLLDELETIRSQLGESFARVRKLVGELDPTLSGPAGKTESAMAASLERLAARVSSAAGRQDETRLLQLRRAAAHLWPGGLPQERQQAAVYYLARYGKDFLEFLLEHIEPGLH